MAQALEKTFVLETDQSTQGLRVVFDWEGDRFIHQVVVLQDDAEPARLLLSAEGTPDEPWPASPPIQEVHLEDRSDGSRVALCVGMAGTSHWSLSVELAADGRTANFDVACRMRDVPDRLGSGYQLLEPSWSDLIELTTPGDASTSMSTDSEDRLRFTPSSIDSKSPQTLQWRYSIAMRSGSNQNEPLDRSGTSGS